MDAVVKQESIEPGETPVKEKSLSEASKLFTLIDLSSSDSDSDDYGLEPLERRPGTSSGSNANANKKRKLDDWGIVLPPGFLDPLPPEEPLPPVAPVRKPLSSTALSGCKQFWKAGNFDDGPPVDSPSSNTGGMDHVRVHPKFLHSNATSHKWALGAIAELLDNSLDEVCHGASFVNIDMVKNMTDGSRMLVIEDNGGGMDPDKMRQCMSLGYSAKSKLANTIGQYGNGFKTSTMRLGADVVMFSRCRGKDGKSPTQSVGMLSYTFLRSTGKEDIVVPMLDYEKGGSHWNKLMRSSPGDWNRNLETILHWSPYSSETDLFDQFNLMNVQGTRIIIYNLWEDDQGELELDFDTDQHDIQVRGVNRDEKKIEMAKQFPNSRHFLTYRHSLRSYASILYLRLPPGFRIVLRGKDVEHHNIVNDMMLTQEVTYRPQTGGDGVPKDSSMVAVVTIGFVKDAKNHIDVQGFNVYHKNRLIKPFWRLWNAAGSDGRGVIGVLEANFVEPAHDKQGFERTTVLSRLEARLVQMQKAYWSSYCHKIGYAPRRHSKHLSESAGKESSPEYLPKKTFQHSKKSTHPPDKNGYHTCSDQKQIGKGRKDLMNSVSHRKKSSSLELVSCFADEDSDCEMQNINQISIPDGSTGTASPAQRSCERESQHASQSFSPNSDNSEIGLAHTSNGRTDRIMLHSQRKAADAISGNANAVSCLISPELDQLKIENCELKKRLKKMEETSLHNVEFETDSRISLHALVNGDDSDPEKCGLIQLKTENHELKDRIKKMEQSVQSELQYERERNRSLEAQIKVSEQKLAELNKEQEALIDIFSEERNRRDAEEENLRKKLKDASNTIQQLLERVRLLEKMKSPTANQNINSN